MFHFFSKAKENIINQEAKDLNKPIEESSFSSSLNQNIEMLQKLFADVDVFVVRTFQNNYNSAIQYALIYFDGVVNSTIINDNIIRPLMLSQSVEEGSNLTDSLSKNVVMINEATKTKKINEIIDSITVGDSVLLVDGSDEVLILNTKEIRTRAIQEPENEKVLSGPREGFNESLIQNLAMVRRKLRTNELKMKYLTLGKITKTKVCVCYIEKVVNKQILQELYRRLNTIDIDAILDVNYIAELIKDCPMSPFRTTGDTERPDMVIGKILEGRIAIFIDGSPVVLTVPYLMIEDFQSDEDYYMNFYYSSFSRILRILGFLLSISVPGIYVAVVAYHHELLPTSLLTNIAIERMSVPLPAALECFIMLLVFDILRETGIRMPTNIGQALSIVGALVIGQAAVDAKLVAAPMIIVVAITGITNLLIPKMNAPVIYVRVFLLLLATSFGLYGFMLGMSCVIIHLMNLTSFGIPRIATTGSLQFQEVKDVFIRAPWWTMITRRKNIARDHIRMRNNGGGSHG